MIYSLYYNCVLVASCKCGGLQEFKKVIYKNKNLIFNKVNYVDKHNNFNRLFSNSKINKIVEGWEIRTYNHEIDVLTKIQLNKIQGKRRKKIKASNFFYVFDIETTNVNDEFSVCYLYGIKKYNYSYNLNDDNIQELSEEYKPFYNKSAILDFKKFLSDVNKYAENNNEITYIFCHNLIFELYELIQNIFPLFSLSQQDIMNNINESVFRGSASKPLMFRFKNLMFMDSLALINKSLAKVSENHKIKKLIENKTYKEQYFFGSKLPNSELQYNENDLDVTALGIMDKIRECKTEFSTFNDFIKIHVSTITGLSKYLNKHIYDDESKNKHNEATHIYRASKNLPKKGKRIDKERILLYQQIFQGGFTHSNIFYSNSVL